MTEVTAETTAAPEAAATEATQATAPQAEGQPEAQPTAEGTKPEAQETIEATTEENTTPANVDLELTAPEGMEMFADDFALFSTEATEWIKANPDATAADAFKWAADRQANAVAESARAAIVARNEKITEWETQLKADKEVGGDKFKESVATALKTLDTWGSPELQKQLDQAGVGNHPDLIRLLVRAGAAMQDAKVLTTNAGGARKSFADALYGGNAN